MIMLYFSFLVLSLQFKIKHADKNVYLCKKFPEETLPPIVPCTNIEEATEFKFDDNGNGTQQVITVDGTKALAIRTDNVVIINDAEKSRSQEFIITNVGSDKYTLKSYGMCMTQNPTNHQLKNCDNSSSQLYINVEGEKPKVPVDPKPAVVKPSPAIERIPNPLIDKPILDKLQKLIEDNNELTRRILESQRRHSIDGHAHRCVHHIHHHHFCDEDKYHTVKKPILTKSELARKNGYPSEPDREFLVKEVVPTTKRDYALESSKSVKSKTRQRTNTSLFDSLKN